MKNKRIKILLVLGVICFIVITSTIILDKNNSKDDTWENPYVDINKNEIEYQENISVDELKKETGLQADSKLYEIKNEYDGRKTLSIKADIQYKVAFAGIIKQQKTTIEEADAIFNEKYPTENGIWINEQSRQDFLELIEENTNSEYEINEKGYLIIKSINEQNENDKLIQKIINSNKKVIISINSIYYEVDIVSGEIVEYPFEKLDNFQAYDKIENDADKIIVITSNSNKMLTNKEIFQELILDLDN